MAHPVKISVITIVYNDVNHIAQTMESIFTQTYPHIEYIIIDGDSCDGTKELILKTISILATITQKNDSPDKFYLEATHNQNPHFCFKFLSQKDKGIYDAMNKGVSLASGEWCNFMNSGDKFYQTNTIEECFKKYFNTLKTEWGGGYSVIYGHTQIYYAPHESKILYTKSNNHRYHHKFIHQSSFIKTSLIAFYKYDTRFKIAGDTDFFTKIYNKGYKFLKIEQIISIFNANGISDGPSWKGFQEDCKIGYGYHKLFPIFLGSLYLFCILPKTLIKSCLPSCIKNKIRVLLGKKYL
ncbi:glycosyltransferase [Helicobacter sp. 11S03491-1]|nr:glycosyltransferase [Helicobacter sp. 11S03491-1]